MDEDDDFEESKLPRRRRRRLREDDEGRGRRVPMYPRQLTIASYIWIKVGLLILINGAVLLIDQGDENNQDVIFDDPVAVIPIMLFGAVFIHVGMHTLHGTAQDTLGNGTGSLIFGLIEFAGGVNLLNAGETLTGLISLASCLGLITAGIFALHARADYLDWLASGKRVRGR